VSDLLRMAEDSLDEFPPDDAAAEMFLRKALSCDADSLEVLDRLGELLCSSGKPDEALPLFEKACRLSPDSGSLKYLYMGQIRTGNEALECFVKGLALLEKEEREAAAGGESSFIRRQMAKAACSIAELFMTDLCDSDLAESECLRYIDRALGYDAECFEAQHCSATYKKTLGDIEGAREECMKCVSILNAAKDEAAGMFDDVGTEGALPLEPPSFEARLNFCRTMIDIGETQQAVEALEDLIDEDEEDVRAWYLLACAHVVDGDREETTNAIASAQALVDEGGWDSEWNDKLREIASQLEKRASPAGTDTQPDETKQDDT